MFGDKVNQLVSKARNKIAFNQVPAGDELKAKRLMFPIATGKIFDYILDKYSHCNCPGILSIRCARVIWALAWASGLGLPRRRGSTRRVRGGARGPHPFALF